MTLLPVAVCHCLQKCPFSQSFYQKCAKMCNTKRYLSSNRRTENQEPHLNIKIFRQISLNTRRVGDHLFPGYRVLTYSIPWSTKSCMYINSGECILNLPIVSLVLYSLNQTSCMIISFYGHLWVFHTSPAAHLWWKRNLNLFWLTPRASRPTFKASKYELHITIYWVSFIIGSNKIITLKPNEVMEHTLKANTYPSRVIGSEDIKENVSFLSIAVNKTGTLLFVATDDSRVVCVDLKTYTHNFDLDNRRGWVLFCIISILLIWVK